MIGTQTNEVLFRHMEFTIKHILNIRIYVRNVYHLIMEKDIYKESAWSLFDFLTIIFVGISVTIGKKITMIIISTSFASTTKTVVWKL